MKQLISDFYRQFLQQAFTYLAWPVLFGLISALFYLHYKNTLLLTSVIQAQSIVQQSVHTETRQNTGPYSYARAVQNAIPSVVNIYTRTRVITRSPLADDPVLRHFFNFPLKERIQSSLGSGVIVNHQGYLLTNYHVTQGADEIIVLLNDGRESLASIVGADPEGQTVTQGIISASSRNGLRVTTNYIQTDAAINPGNSGGALVDAEGKLLGINTSILNKTGASIGIGFAIPVDTAMKVLDDISQYGRVLRGALGIVPKAVPPNLATELQLQQGMGILITAIYSNSPAHHAGLMPGDIIIKLDGNLIMGNDAGLDVIAKSVPGKEIPILVYRQGKVTTLKITPALRSN
jgi:serine protease DegS